MRGIIKLHGRNVEHQKSFDRADVLQQRNDKLCWRFFYHDILKRKRYEDVLESLSGEFFLHPNTIASLLLKNELTSKLMDNKPTLLEVKNNSYPFVFELSLNERYKYNESNLK